MKNTLKPRLFRIMIFSKQEIRINLNQIMSISRWCMVSSCVRCIIQIWTMLLIYSFQSSNEITCIRQEWSWSINFQKSEIIEWNFITTIHLFVAGEHTINRCSKLRLSDIENVFNERLELFNIRYIIRSVAEQKLRYDHIVLARHFGEVSETEKNINSHLLLNINL